MLPLPIEFAGVQREDIQEVKTANFPAWLGEHKPPRILPPTQQKITQFLAALNQNYEEIIILSISSRLSQTFQELEKAIGNFSGSARIYLIDTQTISIGQGFLVEQAARDANAGLPASDIEHNIRKTVPHIFNLFCTPSLSYLNNSGIIDCEQAVVSEYYNLYPLFVLEDGVFTSLIKVRNYRAALESFQEFLGEFENLKHISILQGGKIPQQDIHLIKQFCEETFPETPFSEHTLNPYLATLFGPGFLGLFIHE